jgi:peptide/nickel transport system permease protein
MNIATLVPPTAATRRRGLLAGWSRAGKLGLAVLAFWVAVALGAQFLNANALGEMSDAGVFQDMSAQHWFGTDYLGRDMLVRIVAGTPYTIGVALLATLIACGTGAVLGLLAAVTGGWVDAALSRVLDTLVSIPSKMFALVVIAGFGSSVPLLVAVAAIVYAPGAYRIIRSLAVNINAMDYVTVARARGEGRAYIMRREVLPNITGPLLADMGLRFVYALRLLASLSFLGLGVQPPTASWGAMLADGRKYVNIAYWLSTFPGLAIMVVVLGVNFLGDWVRERLDPKFLE